MIRERVSDLILIKYILLNLHKIKWWSLGCDVIRIINSGIFLLFIGSAGILLTGVLWLYFGLLVIMPGPRANNNFMLFFLFIFLAFMEIGGAVAGFKLIQELRKKSNSKSTQCCSSGLCCSAKSNDFTVYKSPFCLQHRLGNGIAATFSYPFGISNCINNTFKI